MDTCLIPELLGWLGVFPRRVNVIGQDEASWQSEFKFTVLSTPLQSIAGDLVEGIFFHKVCSSSNWDLYPH